MPLKVNGETFVVADSPLQRTIQGFSFEVEGPDSAEYRLTEADQADPIGRYRFRVEGDTLHVQRAASARWASSTDILTLTPTKLTSNVQIDLTSLVDSGLLANITNLVVDVLPPTDANVDTLWLDDQSGYIAPTRRPDGYLAITVEDEIALVPYWRQDINAL